MHAYIVICNKHKPTHFYLSVYAIFINIWCITTSLGTGCSLLGSVDSYGHLIVSNLDSCSTGMSLIISITTCLDVGFLFYFYLLVLHAMSCLKSVGICRPPFLWIWWTWAIVICSVVFSCTISVPTFSNFIHVTSILYIFLPLFSVTASLSYDKKHLLFHIQMD